MKLLRSLWNDVRQGENIDLYLAVFAALLLAALNLFQLASPEWISSITLAVLAVLAVAMVTSRHRMERIYDRLVETPDEVLLRRWPEQDMERDFARAHDLLLVGVSLRRTLRNHYTLIEDKLRQGCPVRVLLVDPHKPSSRAVAERLYREVNVEHTRSSIRSSLAALRHIRDAHGGDLEIRTVDCPLGIGGLAFDARTPNGVLYVEYYTFKMPDEALPKLVLRPGDGDWYGYFYEQLNVLWESGVEYNG